MHHLQKLLISNLHPYWTGSSDTATKSENSLVKAHDTLDGWMKFDITIIPSDATIDSVIFHGYVNDTNYPYWSITPLSNDLITTDANTLNADIVDEILEGYYLFANEGDDYAVGEHSYPLVGSIKNDIANAISSGWFAVEISISSSNVILSWDDSGASSYKIYATDTPTGTFSEVTSSGNFIRLRNRITWQTSIPLSAKKFYQIKSSSE